MSYSLSTVRSDTKEGVLEKLSDAFDLNVLSTQPVHEMDKQTHLENVARQLDLLPPLRPAHEYTATMNGYLSWERLDPTGQVTKEQIVGAGFGCSVGMRRKEVV